MEEGQEQQQETFIPRQATNPAMDGVLNKHLDSSDILLNMEKMLKGYEFDEEQAQWVFSMRFLGYDKETNQERYIKSGPMMDIIEINNTIGFMRNMMNSNTFLSYLDDDIMINEMMWDINIKLAKLFHRLRFKVAPNTREFMWGAIEYPIYMSLKRASGKVTLDAVSKMQHSVEHKTIGQETPEQKQAKQFKIFG